MSVTKFAMKIILKKLTNLVLCGLILVVAGNLFAQQTVKVSPANSEVGKSCIYKLEFTLPDSLPPKGAIVIAFPSQYDLSGVNIGASSKIKGGFITKVIKGQLVVVRKGDGPPLKPGKKVDIFLSSIKNPNVTFPNDTFKLNIEQNGKLILKNFEAGIFKTTVNEGHFIYGKINLSTEK